MRRRLIAAFVGLAVALITLYGVPRAFFLTELVQDHKQELVDRRADVAQAVLSKAGRLGEPVTEEVLLELMDDSERIAYRTTDGRAIVLPEGARTAPDDLRAIRELEHGGTVEVRMAASEVREAVRSALLPLAWLWVGVVVASGVAGWWLSRRLSQPFAELAVAAGRLGQGRLDRVHEQVPHYDIPEAEAIGAALRRSSAQLDTLMRREREVAVNASHELRTPITALRLALEDLALWPQTAPDVADELSRLVAEVDRLSAAVTHLLDRSRMERLQDSELCDLGEWAAEAVQRWRPYAETHEVALVTDLGQTVLVRLPQPQVIRLLDLLLRLACDVALGTVVVWCADRVTHVALGASGPFPGETVAAFTRSGAYAELEEAAVQLGGRLAIDPGQITEVMVMLPRPDPLDRSDPSGLLDRLDPASVTESGTDSAR